MSAGLRYVGGSEPGIRRRRQGRRFIYLRPDGRPVRAPGELARIAGLAIPPAYVDVWICRDPRGHLQATGRDARGRRQYRYHAQWRARRDEEKFGRMISFGAALPRLRRRLRHDLASPGLPLEKVLAVIVSLLDITHERIGNEEYARSNHSFGLTTLRDRHVSFVRDGRALLQFRGKGGMEHVVPVDDRRLAAIVRRCQHIPGQQLFQYLDDSGKRQGVDSGQVNAYLQAAMGAEFTAKDFRTWSATSRALVLIAAIPRPQNCSERRLERCIRRVVEQVADEMRNTPAVCRKSYINPRVFEAWSHGAVQAPRVRASPGASRAACERMTLAFLRHERRAGGLLTR